MGIRVGLTVGDKEGVNVGTCVGCGVGLSVGGSVASEELMIVNAKRINNTIDRPSILTISLNQ